jgi:hypothetical protein
MAFVIYKQDSCGQNARYERVGTLRLGGPEGVIARHVKSLSSDQTTSWRLERSELLILAGITDDKLTILFDLSGSAATSVCFYELTRVCGSCRDTSTNLALNFNVVLDCEGKASDFRAAFEAPRLAAPKQIAETLSLNGGPCGGDWTWAKAALQIGATVVQGRKNSKFEN